MISELKIKSVTTFTSSNTRTNQYIHTYYKKYKILTAVSIIESSIVDVL